MEDLVANGDAMETAQQCAEDAGAIVKCSSCYEYFVATGDEAAEQKAVAIALGRRDGGERGFRGMEDKEVTEVVEAAIQDAGYCPRCSRNR
jgi:hypothetical protein